MTEENKTIDVSQKVLDKISEGKVKMRPKWRFLTEKIGLEASVFIFLIFSLLATLIIYYYWEENEIYELVPLGSNVWQHLIISFPYELLILIMLLGGASAYLIRKISRGFKISFFYWLCILAGTVFIVSQIIFALHYHRNIIATLKESKMQAVKDYHDKRLQYFKNNNIRGVITVINPADDTMMVRISSTSEMRFVPSRIHIIPLHVELKPGEKIKMIGEWNNDMFDAWGAYVYTN